MFPMLATDVRYCCLRLRDVHVHNLCSHTSFYSVHLLTMIANNTPLILSLMVSLRKVNDHLMLNCVSFSSLCLAIIRRSFGRLSRAEEEWSWLPLWEKELFLTLYWQQHTLFKIAASSQYHRYVMLAREVAEKKIKGKKKALTGFEPVISCLLDRRFNQLSHRATLAIDRSILGMIVFLATTYHHTPIFARGIHSIQPILYTQN